MAIDILSWIATALSLGGNILIARKNKLGFIVWIISNSLWIIVNLIGQPNIAQITMFGIFIITNAYGIWQWKKEPPEES